MFKTPAMKEAKHLTGVVTSRRNISSDLWIVRVQPEERIAFLPGQYVTIGLPGSAKMVERPYSVASSPREPELEFFLELVPGGELTSQLYEIPVGGEVYLRRIAKGRFLFDDKSGHRNHFMVATVTGVAPYLSMLREFVARAREGEQNLYRIVILHGASFSIELGYREELAAYASEYEWFDYIPTVSRIWLDGGWSGERGRAEDVTRKYLDGFGLTPADTTAYVCGNPNMIKNVEGVFERAGFAKQFIRQEVYWVVG